MPEAPPAEGPSCPRLTTAFFIAFLTGSVLALSAQTLPPKPAGNEFTTDQAGLFTQETRERIAQFQRKAFESFDVPIIVVTINRMSDYGASGTSIEEFARKWFDHWEIGTLSKKGGGANKGILLLVSQGDRRARIELGADWGHKWDGETQRIMDNVIIPQFKAGKFANGIVDGVEKLTAMAEAGPGGSPSSPGWGERLAQDPNIKKATSLSLFSSNTLALMVGGGVLLIVASFFFPAQRKPLLIAGIALIAIALFTYLVLVVLALFMKGKSRGGYSSGGGFGGGSSGGGGASGSW